MNSSIFVGCTPQSLNLGQFTLGAIVASVPWTATKAGPSQKLRVHFFPLFDFLQLKILHAPSFSTVVGAWKNQARRMRKSGWKKYLFQKAFLPENVQLSSWQNST